MPMRPDSTLQPSPTAHSGSEAARHRRVEESLRRRVAELTALHRVGAACAHARSEDELLAEVTRAVAEGLYPDNCGVLLVDRARGVLRHHHSFSLTSPTASADDIPLGVGVCGWVAASGTPRVIHDTAAEPDYLSLDPAMRSEVCVPVRIGGAVVAVLDAESGTRNAFGADDVSVLTTAASLLGNALERLRAAEAHRQSDSFLHLVWESAADGIRMTDGLGTVLRANPAYCRMVGRPEAEVVGCSLADVYAPVRRDGILCEYRERFQTRTVHPKYEAEVELWDGSGRWFEVTSVFLETSDQPRLLSLFRDITDRKRAESALRERENLLGNILATIPGSVFWKDRNGVFLGCNERFALDLGFASPEEVVGKVDYDLSVTREEADFFVACDQRVMATGEPLLNIEETQHRPDGSQAVLLTSKVPLRDETGAAVGVLGVYHNITERKQLEEQYRQSQKLEAVGRLAGGIAHDFNNLLTVINGYSDLLLSVGTGDRTQDAAAAIRDAGERAAALTRQLLAFSRKAIIEPKILDLNEVVARTERLLRRLIGEDVALATDLDSRPTWVRADAGQLEQVLLNLAVNARDAMPGGGRLTITTREVEFGVGAPDVPPGRYAELAVSDTGCGMNEDLKANIFEPFFTTKEVGKGTGLGLATVYGIVKTCGGHIRVDSKPGAGTRFTILIPFTTDMPTGPLSGLKGLAPRGAETLLLVEDEESVRRFARIALQAQGYKVLEAGDGTEALRVADEFAGRIDLLVTDVVMPEMGGRLVADALRSRRPELRVLYVSGYTDDEVVRHGVSEAEVHFLSKPYSPAALARQVRQVLDEPE
jgi:two-component system, cell cycle sensor histidine kinase and response regulator CckA